MTEPLTAEGTGETVEEAKVRALRELERLAPSLDAAAVRFQVLEEGKRGMLGVGYVPARVLAAVSVSETASEESEARDESELAGRVRRMLERVAGALGVPCTVEITETPEELVAMYEGEDLGLLIGRRGATIDALQTLASAVAARGESERKRVVVDASGYRERRRRTLEETALRGAEQAVETGERVELEPMSAPARRIVHERLKDHEGVSTLSEGDEPNRRVVIEPA